MLFLMFHFKLPTENQRWNEEKKRERKRNSRQIFKLLTKSEEAALALKGWEKNGKGEERKGSGSSKKSEKETMGEDERFCLFEDVLVYPMTPTVFGKLGYPLNLEKRQTQASWEPQENIRIYGLVQHTTAVLHKAFFFILFWPWQPLKTPAFLTSWKEQNPEDHIHFNLGLPHNSPSHLFKNPLFFNAFLFISWWRFPTCSPAF